MHSELNPTAAKASSRLVVLQILILRMLSILTQIVGLEREVERVFSPLGYLVMTYAHDS